MEDAESHASVGECGEVRREVTAGLELSRDNLTLERASRSLGLCRIAESSNLTGELTKRFPTATLTNRVSVPIAVAALALAKGEYGRLSNRLEPVQTIRRWLEFWSVYLRGQAYLRLKNTQARDRGLPGIVAAARKSSLDVCPFVVPRARAFGRARP